MGRRREERGGGRSEINERALHRDLRGRSGAAEEEEEEEEEESESTKEPRRERERSERRET